MLDLSRILGAERHNDYVRLLGPSATTVAIPPRSTMPLGGVSLGTFERVVAHSEPGCCAKHDGLRRDKRLRTP